MSPDFFGGIWRALNLRNIAALAFGAGSLLVAAPSAQAAVFSNFAVFAANDRSIWSDGPAFVFDTGPKFAGIEWDKGASIGGTKCFLGACVGAEIGAETSGRFGFDYGLKVNSGSFDISYPTALSFSTPSAYFGTTIGDITVGSGFTPIPGATMQVTGPTAQAYVDLSARFHAFAGARVCVVACVGPALGPIDFDKSQTIAAINRNGDGKLTVLGESVSANTQVTALGGLLHASLNLPDLDSSSAYTPGGFEGGVLTSTMRDQVATLTGDLGQIVATALGLPIPLSGNAGGFGYTLLQAAAGVSLDVQQSLQFTPQISASYIFSAPVIPIIGGVEQAATNIINFNIGDNVTFRPGQVEAITYVPMINFGGSIRDTIDLIIQGQIDVKAFGVDIADQTLGPIIDESLSGDLGSVRVFDKTFSTSFGAISWAPITLDFVNCRGGNYGSVEFPSYGICSSSGFFATSTETTPDGLMVDNLDAYTCGAARTHAEQFCGQFPSGLQTGPYLDIPFFGRVYYNDGSAFAFEPFVPGTPTTDQDQRDRLDAQGGLPSGSFDIPRGTPAIAFLPEPGTWATMLAGFAAIGSLMRRRKWIAMA